MRFQDLDLDAIQRRNREALTFATEQVGGSEHAPETVLEHFNDDVPVLVDALGRAFAVIRQNEVTEANHQARDGVSTYTDAILAVGRLAAQHREQAEQLKNPDSRRVLFALAEQVSDVAGHLELLARLRGRAIAVTPAAGTCPTCGRPHDHVHVCAVCGEAELDDGKPFTCPTHDQPATGLVYAANKAKAAVPALERVRTDDACADEWQPPHKAGSHPEDCRTCGEGGSDRG